jgi:predicted transcriptional regulator
MTLEQKETVFQMRDQGLSYAEIASALKISRNTVKSFCRRSSPTLEKTALDNKQDMHENHSRCKQCGTLLITHGHRGKPRLFCCDACRRTWWKENNSDTPNRKAYYRLICMGCKQEFKSYGNKARKYCGHACYIRNRFGGGEHDQRAV